MLDALVVIFLDALDEHQIWVKVEHLNIGGLLPVGIPKMGHIGVKDDNIPCFDLNELIVADIAGPAGNHLCDFTEGMKMKPQIFRKLRLPFGGNFQRKEHLGLYFRDVRTVASVLNQFALRIVKDLGLSLIHIYVDFP